MGPLLLALSSVLVSASTHVAPQDAGREAKDRGTFVVEARVGSSQRGSALIDRGAVDHLASGDLVLFFPRAGGTYQGTVIELAERAARVELQDPDFLPAAGTRAEVQIPRERLATTPARPRLVPVPKRPMNEPSESPIFENQDEDWSAGDPLLARVRPPRPDERTPLVYGRAYALLDYTQSSEDDRVDGFGRVGGNAVYENFFGCGERVHVDGEWNYRSVDVPDLEDEEDVELRVDRLSYASGGSRFEPEGWEAGRFLQGGMPEFGVLDGIEWSERRGNGQRYGASVGFLPEPDGEYRTGSDLQVAGFYRWVLDESEQLSAAAGYQKSFHNGATDRDLIVASLRRLPRSGWTLFSTAWIDLYTEGDDAKGTLLGLTQAYLAMGRRWASGSSMDLVYSHLEFPEIERNEFRPVTDDQLADDHNERLALRSALQLTADARLLTTVGGWSDQDEAGGDMEIGLGLRDFLAQRFFANLSAFATRGRFETGLGGRFSLGRLAENGRWSLDYELSAHRLDGFTANNDDLPQHRLRLNRDVYAPSGWDLALRLEGVLYDQEQAITLGLYLQRTF